jgi:hypothetical protein
MRVLAPTRFDILARSTGELVAARELQVSHQGLLRDCSNAVERAGGG